MVYQTGPNLFLPKWHSWINHLNFFNQQVISFRSCWLPYTTIIYLPFELIKVLFEALPQLRIVEASCHQLHIDPLIDHRVEDPLQQGTLRICNTMANKNWLVVWNINFIFPYIGNNHPNWLIFFRWVQTTNQKRISNGYFVRRKPDVVVGEVDPNNNLESLKWIDYRIIRRSSINLCTKIWFARYDFNMYTHWKIWWELDWRCMIYQNMFLYHTRIGMRYYFPIVRMITVLLWYLAELLPHQFC